MKSTPLFGLVLSLLTLPVVVNGGDYTYETNNGTITIKRGYGTAEDVIIPSEIGGLPVTSIGDWAFHSCYSLTSITIPNSVTSIGDFAFQSCWELTNITIPNSVTSIGLVAFSGCRSLTSVTIPNSVTHIGDGPFESCTSLTTIAVDPANSAYISVDGVLFDKSIATLIQCPSGKIGHYSVPDSVTSIGRYAFSRCTSLTSITIPDSVTSIEGGAFSDCTSLTSITIPNSVTIIGRGWTFSGCTSLTSVTIGNSVTSIEQVAFAGCTSLTSITIPNSVTSIGRSAFDSCTSLTSITIPDRVTSIRDQAFYGCRSLTSVTIPNSVTNIGGYTFERCYGLTGIYFKGNPPSVDSGVFNGAPTTVYYLPGTTGWGPTFAGRPTALWLLPTPVILTTSSSIGIKPDGFGFTVSWATNTSVVVEASPSLTTPTWSPVATNALVNGWFKFRDAQWANHTGRFYRLRSE